MKEIADIIRDSIATKQALLLDSKLMSGISNLCEQSVQLFAQGRKMLLCGNGGSASDAQHIAAELTGRFYFDRSPLDAEALHVNTSYLTAVANDYGYDEVYARLVRAKAKPGDMLVALSTSGNSENILQAALAAKEIGMIIVAFTGSSGGKLKNLADILINIPSTDTPRIQESHILIGHIMCEYIEEKVFRG